MSMRKWTGYSVFLVLYVLVTYLTLSGLVHNYVFLSLLTAGGISVVYFLSFENRNPASRDIMPVVVVCAIGSVGRTIFAFLPQVQPITAMVIIMGIVYGKQTGFMTGALSALISNMFLGQGPWTPWQMLAWGLVGWLSGWLGKWGWSRHPAVYCTVGFFSAFLFSLVIDTWTLASLGEALNVMVVKGVYAAGFLFNIGHAVGNVIFLLLLFGPFTRKLERLKEKYGVLSDEQV